MARDDLVTEKANSIIPAERIQQCIYPVRHNSSRRNSPDEAATDGCELDVVGTNVVRPK